MKRWTPSDLLTDITNRQKYNRFDGVAESLGVFMELPAEDLVL